MRFLNFLFEFLFPRRQYGIQSTTKHGVVVRSRSLVGNIAAGLRSLRGGEITEYTRLVEDTRRHAIDRMIENARLMGANAVVMMRFDSSEMGQTMSEVVAYGTAVLLDPPPPA